MQSGHWAGRPRRVYEVTAWVEKLDDEATRDAVLALALNPALSPLWFLTAAIFNLPRSNPHDMDGIADHVSRTLLAFGASRHLDGLDE
jgi:hypothetical protein